MTLEDLGEFGLIDRIKKWTSSTNRRVVSIGDDAAVFSFNEGWETVWSVDALVEGIHFDRSYVPMKDLGWKALAVNLSDLAAMGCIPRYALITLAIPETWTLEDIDLLYQGLNECSATYRCQIIGGDTTRSNKDGFISISVVGEVEKGRAVLRSGAQAGDTLFCTGLLGKAKAGFEILSSGSTIHNEAVQRFLRPEPRVYEARWLVENYPITAMIDISDGLASEVHHLCHGSNVGCILKEKAIPVSSDLLTWSELQNRCAVEDVLISGEEYELLFTLQVQNADDFIKQAYKNNVELHVIGQMTSADQGIQLQTSNGLIPLENKGWNHFK